jgi:polyhydroxyalkanoate synthesis regulator phasin
MRYVQRDPNTKLVVGHFANPQSFAQEELPDDHPDIIAYAQRRLSESNVDPVKDRIDALEARIADLEARIKTRP